MINSMDALLNNIENIKEKLSSAEYKKIMDIMMSINVEINELKNKNKKQINKIKILTNRYINLSTLFVIIASEREGFNITNILDVCDCDTHNIDQEYNEYIMNQ